MSATETGDVQPPQQIELAEQLYAVWVRNSTDPQLCPEWGDLEGDARAQWRALAEVYARLSLYQAEVSTHSRIVSELHGLEAEITGHLDVRIGREIEAQAAQSRNPDNKSDLVWDTDMHRRSGVIATLREVLGKVENMTKHRIEALNRF